MKENIIRITDEYNKKVPLYAEFGSAMHSLFRSILKNVDYKYHISYRVKDLQSLQEKIERKRARGRVYKKLRDLNDIMGIRVIFYTESDRKNFILKIQKEFKKTLKIKKTFKISGYRAIHAILSLGEDRLKLSEYKNFKGLKCEVQLSLILEHAWAEIEHDILYKENWGFRKMNAIHYLTAKEQMERVMKNHIERASTELERIVFQVKRIKRNNII